MNKSTIIGIIIVILILAGIVGSCSGPEHEDHDDGKCDICGKRATYSDSSEEYCDRCFEDAVEWYIKQAQDD